MKTMKMKLIIPKMKLVLRKKLILKKGVNNEEK